MIIIGSLISGIALCKLFLIQELPFDSYLLIWIALLYFGWTLFQIPYLSIGYDLENNYFNRTKLSATREIFIVMGLFFSLCVPMVFQINNIKLAEYLVNTALISGFFGVCILCFFVRNNKKKKKVIPIKKIIIDLGSHSKLKNFLFIWFVNSIANVLPMILFAFYITYVLDGDDFDRQKTLFFYFLFAIIGIPFWTQLSKKTNKSKAWAISLLSSSIFFFFVVLLESQDFILFIIISCLTGFCLGADLVLPPSIQADMTDIHKQKYKDEISGVLFSLITSINKLSFALGSFFVFGILGLIGFSTDSPVSENSKSFIIFSYALLPVILKLLAFFVLRNFESNGNELIKN